MCGKRRTGERKRETAVVWIIELDRTGVPIVANCHWGLAYSCSVLILYRTRASLRNKSFLFVFVEYLMV